MILLLCPVGNFPDGICEVSMDGKKVELYIKMLLKPVTRGAKVSKKVF